MSSPDFVTGLRRFGERPALVRPGADPIGYGELDDLVAARAAQLAAGQPGSGRRLVLVQLGLDVASIIDYLAVLRAGHVGLLAGTGRGSAERVVAAYRPDCVLHETADGGRGERWEPEPLGHELHPDLAVLLSTSGATGAAKLVRLSAANLESNAAAIASYLPIRPTDRAVTTLPLHYCYGLSVLHSNLREGAALLVTDRSVAQARFFDDMRELGGTSLHGVPYTFELLDAVGFAEQELPSLRYVTQAGGRLAPATIRRYAELGDSRGWSFHVMYGQTEATARMAHLPPEDATRAPGAIGVPIPGSTMRIDRPGPDGVGELIFCGPGVMLGYAHGPEDLARGRTVTELATGDLARRRDDGLFEVVGRRNRFIKPYGLRIGLDEVDAVLADAGLTAASTGSDTELVVACAAGSSTQRATELLTERLRLPICAVRVVPVEELPRTASGKIDAAVLARLTREPDEPSSAPPAATTLPATTLPATTPPATTPPATTPPTTTPPTTTPPTSTQPTAPAPAPSTRRAVREAFRSAFPGERITEKDTFAGLGGDSLRYVQVSTALQRVLGRLPAGWPDLPVGELARSDRPPGRWVPVESPILLRAAAIVLIVGSHVGLFRVLGGSHVLLAVAGWAFARFTLAPSRAGSPAAAALRTAAGIAVPSALWIAWRASRQDDMQLYHAALLNYLLDPFAWGYWFVETLVQILVLLALVFAIPAVRRAERAVPFGFAAAALAVAALGLGIDDGANEYTTRLMSPHMVLWLFVLGWLVQRAGSPAQRLAALLLTIAAIPPFFEAEPLRGVVVTLGVALLLVPALPVPRLLVRPLGALAGASLAIYLTHYAVFPELVGLPLLVSVAACVAVGVGAQEGARRLARLSRALGEALRRSALAYADRRADLAASDGVGDVAQSRPSRNRAELLGAQSAPFG